MMSLPRGLSSSGQPSVQTNAAASTSRTSLVNPQVLALADPPTHQVDARLFEYISFQMVSVLAESSKLATQKRVQRQRRIEEDFGLKSRPASSRTSLGSSKSKDNASADEIKERDSHELRVRLEQVGFKTGWGLSERLCRDRPPFPRQTSPSNAPSNAPSPPDPLEVVKFVCKDVWVAVFDKQIDNLRTNHRGVYVLQDNAFKPLLRLSGSEQQNLSDEVVSMGSNLLPFPSGIVRGVLHNLGLKATVTAELGGAGQCTFQIKLAASANASLSTSTPASRPLV
ncbi:uncharacterized protein L969DRAFT_104359 [Mixia osmundae IAM 14324]|uniref:Trafficking protein particle complex subunit 6B n=1 Tax=Mixia osmundae (strain CBS 9802 / IAM 14324 / JCM 22182 / KY 12970) TaxID=764103 RepID=G7E7T9_MIXOS|nr:uncharacterized protein L969DRAFT_104359 [Mixia osmundae IAM 14324]KEI38500.1 hypothetical protein L969DRAFT_104359 [Mixia osmundae IAM 14324]GAA98899.1 hypothetical protein E5Q_05587 [Mixia osmundae IAM 14324]